MSEALHSAPPSEEQTPAGVRTAIGRVTNVLNAVRLGSVILPVAGMGGAIISGAIVPFIVTATAAMAASVIGTYGAARFFSSKLRSEVRQLRAENKISGAEADELEELALRIVNGTQPSVPATSV